MIKILAGQATVAIRNALLYREVPLIGLLEPLVQRKRALLGTSAEAARQLCRRHRCSGAVPDILPVADADLWRSHGRTAAAGDDRRTG